MRGFEVEAIKTMTVIARKPKVFPAGTIGSLFERPLEEFVVVDRGDGHLHRFVSATMKRCFESVKVDKPSKIEEWYWGHYFATADEALAHFNAR